MSDNKLTRSDHDDIRSFLDQLAATPVVKAAVDSRRLLFAIDATASREPTWRTARATQREMFEVAASLGGIEIQLCYFRGIDEVHVGRWQTDGTALGLEMSGVRCAAGYTQIERVLRHAIREARRPGVTLRALIYVGDCVEEVPDALYALAGELGLLGIKAFVFMEGRDPAAEPVFRQIARLSGGAFCRFGAGSAEQLRQLLGAVAAYVAGGLTALDRYGGSDAIEVRQLRKQLGRSS